VKIEIIPDLIAIYVLIFARIGTMVMLLPALGERSVPARVRLGIALLLSLLFYPVAQPLFAGDLRSLPALVSALGAELGVGLVLGIAGRTLLSCMQTAGTTIANQLGLGFVTTIDPSQNQQGAIISGFLSITGLTLIFATDLHYLAIAALADSYRFFRPGTLPETGDALKLVLDIAAGAFRVGLQLAAPFLVFGLIFNIGLGILARLMPQMQVFFIAMPATILGGLALLAVMLGVIMTTFHDYVAGGLAMLAGR
jgi:flagellar biosynthetic protein FliR